MECKLKGVIGFAVISEVNVEVPSVIQGRVNVPAVSASGAGPSLSSRFEQLSGTAYAAHKSVRDGERSPVCELCVNGGGSEVLRGGAGAEVMRCFRLAHYVSQTVGL